MGLNTQPGPALLAVAWPRPWACWIRSPGMTCSIAAETIVGTGSR